MRRLFHFETRHQKPASRERFLARLQRNGFVSGALVAVMLGIGMLGYRGFEGMGWVDAFVNAAMILSGMGPLGTLNTVGGKLFAGCYALASGLLFVVSTSILLAPLVHRMFHRFHVEAEADAARTGPSRNGEKSK